MTKAKCITAMFAVAAAMFLVPQSSQAQTARWIGGTGNWNTGSNWDIDGFNFPDAGFDGEALIGNGGVASVGINITQNAPEIFLGTASGMSGTLNINNGGTLHVVANASRDNLGGITVGNNGGTGTLNVANGGTLTIEGPLRSETGGNGGSRITLNGSASVTAGSAFLDRQLVINGAGVNFDVTGNLVLGLAGNHAWEIDAAGNVSTISVGADADLGGTLRLFSTSYAPNIGDTFTLIDSATADFGELPGQTGFSSVDTSGITLPNAGADFRIQSVDNGSGGVFTQAIVEQQPILVVNRATGNVSITNPGSGTSIDFDAYSIRSNGGSLVPGNWDTLQAAAPPTGNWFVANPQPTGLSELNVGGSSSLAGGTSFNLGDGVFDLPAPTAFGDENEDIRFQLGRPGGELIEGIVQYTGMPNNTLVLNVNPTTGAAQLINPSPFDVAIDTYAITSQTGSLLTSWSSFADSGIAGTGWFEANASTSQLSELQAIGSTDINGNFASLLSLGTAFNSTTGVQDLLFRFALVGEDFFRTGKVVYGDLVTGPPLLVGDYNGDGVVNAADYTVWRDTQGSTGMNLAADGNNDMIVNGTDYNLWRANFGQTLGGGSGSLATGSANVPEPTALLLCLVMGSAVASTIRRRWR